MGILWTGLTLSRPNKTSCAIGRDRVCNIYTLGERQAKQEEVASELLSSGIKPGNPCFDMLLNESNLSLASLPHKCSHTAFSEFSITLTLDNPEFLPSTGEHPLLIHKIFNHTDGEKYFIDKCRCRQKDIAQVFMTAGIGGGAPEWAAFLGVIDPLSMLGLRAPAAANWINAIFLK